MSKKLIIIATPIGNINEISNRAIQALNQNKNFFCEDTRVFKKLLSILNINHENKKMFTLNSINENKMVDNFNFIDETYCLVSDAGYPILSDPGFYLINFFIKNNWDIEIINGPSSLMHALVISGFCTKNTLFYGFLDHNENKKNIELLSLKKENKTIVIFESVHRIKNTLNQIKKIFGDNVSICVCRELTKLNETIYRGQIDDILKNVNEKGEFVILINNQVEIKNKDCNLNDYLYELKTLIQKGEKEKNACKMIGYKYNLKPKDLYDF